MSLEGQQQGQGEPGSGGGPASDPTLQQPLTPPPSDFEPQSPGVIAKAPPAYEPAIQADYPDTPPTVATTTPPPGGMGPGFAPAGPRSGATGPSRPKGRGILLAGLALLIIASGVAGIFYSIVRSNQIATANAHATATAAVFNATATAQAQSIAATADAFNATATTVAANATGTATAYQQLYTSATSGTPALSDPLSDNSNGNRWSEGSDSTGTCAFAGGTYHASSSQRNTFVFCDAQSTDFRNFAYQVQMKIIKGEEGGTSFALMIRMAPSMSSLSIKLGLTNSLSVLPRPPNATQMY